MAVIDFSSKKIPLTTSNSFENKSITEYKGVLISDTTIGRHIGRDFLSSVRDIFGGRSRSWEKSLGKAQEEAISELIEHAISIGANGIVAINLEDEVVGTKGGMINVKAVGTAVVTA